MLLRDSDIARSVRTHLLDAEEDLRASYVSLDRRVTRIEGCLAGVGSALQELGPVLGRMSERLGSLDRKLDVTHQVVGAISLRLTDVSQDVIRLDARMDELGHRLRELGRREEADVTRRRPGATNRGPGAAPSGPPGPPYARVAVRSSSSSTIAMPSCSFDAVISWATAFRSSCALAMATPCCAQPNMGMSFGMSPKASVSAALSPRRRAARERPVALLSPRAGSPRHPGPP